MFRKIKEMKSATTEQIQMLKVGTKEYHGENVKNGFFQSISDLKSREIEPENKNFLDQMDDYNNILDICKMKRDLPNISLEDSTNILYKMKSNVNDIFCITTLHYINAGSNGIEHFNFLLNCIIDDVNNASIEELNSIYALLLHKGHGKPKTVSSAYRTISTCPLLSKAMDLYIRDLHIGKWNNQQAETQYQGEGSSHELAALLVTEVVQHSLFSLKEPAYLLFLDAKSAYDTVKPERLIKNMYTAGMDGNTIVYMNQRLINRLTFLEWDKNLMGPIMDEHGLEQGGSNSSDLYKLYNNELLKTTQKSTLGIPLRKSLVISSVGQADDTVLTANKLSNLSNILVLTKDYCDKYSVTLCPDKTKLMRLTRVADNYMEMMNPIVINDTTIPFSECAEHVGILRSTDGNLPHIMKRITSHKKALGSVMFAGIAQKHRANPAAGLKIERMYGNPVLMSGLASLVLSGHEQTLIDQHGKQTYQNLQKLHDRTPDSVVYFLGGCLPASAEIHLRQFSLFGMITRLSSDPLNIHARNILTEAKPSSKSWFCQLRELCLQYGLPHPLKMLENPLNKMKFKKLIRSNIINYWENKLRGEASLLQSLEYFHPNFMSLSKPHPIWTTAGSNPHEVSKAVQQARFLSGRYRSESLARHWSKNPKGFCLMQTCENTSEDTMHILVDCKAYDECKKRLYSLWLRNGTPIILKLVIEAFSQSREYLLQFILDCSSLPAVILAAQSHGNKIYDELFYLTRTWCFSIHRHRMKVLGRWNYQ